MSLLFHKSLVVASGAHDTGKTTFAISCGAKPSEIAFIDQDIKGKQIAREMNDSQTPFGMYRDLVRETAGKLELAVYDHCMSIVTELEKSQLPVIIWDTWTPFENTFQPYVQTHMNEFRAQWSAKGDIKGAQIWQSSFVLESNIINRLMNCCDLLILTLHLKDESINGRKSGKQIPDCKKALDRLANFRVFLHHSAKGPYPVMLVLKRMARFEASDDGIKPVSIFPRRVEPGTWDKLRWYWDNPVGDKEPTPEETPSEFELSLLDSTLTPDQKFILSLTPVEEEEESSPVSAPVYGEDITAKVKQMRDNGKRIIEISKELNLPLADVGNMLKQ